MCSDAQSCPTRCDHVDCSLGGLFIHGILQSRILEWVTISSSRGSSRPRDWTCVSFITCIGRCILTTSATWGALCDANVQPSVENSPKRDLKNTLETSVLIFCFWEEPKPPWDFPDLLLIYGRYDNEKQFPVACKHDTFVDFGALATCPSPVPMAWSRYISCPVECKRFLLASPVMCVSPETSSPSPSW